MHYVGPGYTSKRGNILRENLPGCYEVYGTFLRNTPQYAAECHIYNNNNNNKLKIKKIIITIITMTALLMRWQVISANFVVFCYRSNFCHNDTEGNIIIIIIINTFV